MATPLAIASVASAVIKLLDEHCPRSLFVEPPRFKLVAGEGLDVDAVKEGCTLLVWRVAVNGSGRNQPARRSPDGRRLRPPLPVDLSIMITPWAEQAERQLSVLGWTLRFLEDHSILDASLLNDALARQEHPPFGPGEAVELISDTPAVADHLGLWDKFRSRWQTSLFYTARMVNLESELGSEEGPPVHTRGYIVGQPAGPQP